MKSSPLWTVSTAGWPPEPDQVPGNNAGKPERPEAPVGTRRVSPSSAEPHPLILLCHSPVASPETFTLNEKLQRHPGRRPPPRLNRTGPLSIPTQPRNVVEKLSFMSKD